MSLAASWISRVVGVSVEYTNFNLGKAVLLPQRIAIIGQGNSDVIYAEDKYLVTNAAAVGARYGYGSPLHLACRQLFPENGDGIKGIPVTIYPLVDDDSGVVSTGAIGATGIATETVSFKLKIGGIQSSAITILKNDTAAQALAKIKIGITSVLNMPVNAGTVGGGSLPLTSKWQGASANDISIDITELVVAGLTFTSTAMTGGAANPDVDDALLLVNDVWETFILNCMNYDDTDTLDKFQLFGEGRWLADVKRPCLVASGCTDDFATRTAVTDARKDDRINFLIVSVDSLELPFVIAARGLAKDIVQTANDDPAMNYLGSLTGLEAGADLDQEDNTTRDLAVKLGSSTNVKISDVAALWDVVTMYHPVAEGLFPAYRYVCDIVKLMNVVYNMDIIQESIKGRPMLPDSDPLPVRSKSAFQPKNVVTTCKNLADSLSSLAIISDVAYTKDNIQVTIDSQNPKRLNTIFPIKISGNCEVNDTTIKWGTYLG
jgi:phage tail sheath gpL-like